MRCRAYNDTPPDGPYLWNALGFTRPHGDPLDHMGATNRNDSLLEMGKGQVIDVDGIYLNMEWDVGPGTLFAHSRQARPGRTPAEHVSGLGAGQLR